MKLQAVIAGLTIVLCWLSPLTAGTLQPSPSSTQQLLTEGLQNLQNQQWTEALSSLRHAYTPPWRQHLSSAWQQRLPFVLGFLYFQTGDDGKAILHLERARESVPILSDYALWYLGRALQRLNRLPPARAALQWLLDAFPESLHRPEALFAAAEVNRRLGDLGRAESLYVQYRREFPNGARQGQGLLGLGLVYRDMGNPAAALAAWRSLWLELPEEPAAEAVPELERTLPTTFAIPPVAVADLYRRGERLFRLHRYREALKAFELARQAAPGQPLAPETLYHVGMAQHHTRDNTAAMETFRQLHDHAPSSSFAATALFMQGRLALRMRQDETFLDHAHTLTARFPGTKEAEEIGYLLGHFYRNRGRVPEAMQAFQHVIERGRRSAFADDAWWYLGWLQYGAGQYERATQTWGRLMNAFPSSSLAGDTLYWQGRALLRAGRTGEASARFEHLWRTYPQTYYGYLAQAQLTGRRAWPWEATWDQSASGALAQSRPPPIPPPTPGTNFHARRGNELWTMRIYRDAAEEFQAASAEGAQHVQFLFYAALAHHWAGEHSQAMHLLRRHGKALAFQGAGLSQADLQEITYPLGALRHLEASALSGIDPLFIGALIMAESAWNPRAFSRVGARGLMQLMPETGQRLAQSTGVALASDDRLFEPHLNLKLGIAYLRQLLQHFNSLLPLALASYNAGEEEVDQWWAKRGNADIEEFIADMPFRETRSYVQRVLVYYAEYQRIYRGKEG